MSYRYKQGDVKDKELLDAEQVRSSLVEQVGSLQALDRDQLPHDAVDENMIAAGALHQMLPTQANQENEAPYRFTDPATRPATFNFLPAYVYPPGVMFKNYAGGGIILCSDSIACKGGVIQAEFSCWTWRETILDSYTDNEVPYKYSITLRVNGRAVASSGPVASHWSNIHLVGTTVAPEGAVQVTVEWSLQGMGENYFANAAVSDAEVPQFCVGGTTLLIQNRRV